MRHCFLPPDHESSLHECLCALRQKGTLHDNIAEFQNLLIQCTLPISPLGLRFYFQEGLKAATAKHLREHHPDNLEQAIELALLFDHSRHYDQPATADWETTTTCHRCNKVGHITPNYPDK
ncbi:hypothetical protein PHMEG_00026894 [Phytophthora megakarya]|uniref:Uncharacterized protein n=1 Tax=Phytophthora megakarya TaxID=4795 RepID=A0A225VB44_9STRA|nr:hypothetical protein PHMEG_00026894 [Phytophthora megakarya]